MNDSVQLTIREGNGERVVTARRGQTLLDALREAGAHVGAPCGGRGTCGKCAVVVNGERVLSCRTKIDTPLTVDISSARKAAILSDTAELKTVCDDCGLALRSADGVVVSHIEGAKREIETGGGVVLGIAVDIGTTTVVVYLEDLRGMVILDVESFLNPQGQWGHDVISRIHYTMEHEQGLVRLRDEIRGSISRAIRELCERNGADLRAVCKTVIAGNNTMLHLFAGEDPATIAQAPYTPRFTQRTVMSGEQAGLSMNPDGVVVLLPSVSAYVGADITAGIASTDMLERDEWSLYIDVGTNGEMAIGRRGELVCCATAAGPAFEGASIACGTGGIEGAIAHVDGDAYETIGGVAPVGICGSGVLDITAKLRRDGAADAGGYMEQPYTVVGAERSATGADIVFTPADIREVQLASAAIFAGIKIMLREAGVTVEQVSRLYLAGGFGNFLRVESAATIGMLPQSLAERVQLVGNGAGSGARLALRSESFGREVERVALDARYVELSMRMDFNEEYVMAMSLESRD